MTIPMIAGRSADRWRKFTCRLAPRIACDKPVTGYEQVRPLHEPTPPPPERVTSTRLRALESFTARLGTELRIGTVDWTEPDPDVRALTINNCLRRQRDSLEGTIALGKAGQGHLAVAFLRTFFEERLWIKFLADMASGDANSLLTAMGRWDVIRALVAQRDFIGDKVMTMELWYPPGFVDARVADLQQIKAELHRLRDRWGWQGTLPSTAWIADQVSLRDEYNYLHSATSRSVHFSAGEVFRRAWGTPAGILVTDKSEFRDYLAEFAYDELWRQHLGTIRAGMDHLHDAGVTVSEHINSEEGLTVLASELSRMGQVPMVHAHEWNLVRPPAGTLMAWALVLKDSQTAKSAEGS